MRLLGFDRSRKGHRHSWLAMLFEMLLLSELLDQCPVVFNSVSPLFNDMFLPLITHSSGIGRSNSFSILSRGLFFERLYDPSAFSTLLLLAQSQLCLSLAWEPGPVNAFSGHGNVLRIERYHKARPSVSSNDSDWISMRSLTHDFSRQIFGG